MSRNWVMLPEKSTPNFTGQVQHGFDVARQKAKLPSWVSVYFMLSSDAFCRSSIALTLRHHAER